MVIFDCDGVLVDSEGLSNRLLMQDLAARGLVMSSQQITEAFLGSTMQAVFVKARGLGAILPDDWVERLYSDLYALLAQGTPMVPGIDKVLDRLDAAAVGYAVASNGSIEKMTITLGQHEALYPRFEHRMFSAHALGIAKPDPGLFLAAAAAAGMAPASCVIVEDSVTGCIAAARAGMRAFGYAPDGDGAALAREGAAVFHDMADLPALLGL